MKEHLEVYINVEIKNVDIYLKELLEYELFEVGFLGIESIENKISEDMYSYKVFIERDQYELNKDEIAKVFHNYKVEVVQEVLVDNDDYLLEQNKYFNNYTIGNLTIRKKEDKKPLAGKDDLNIYLNPGKTFGYGNHETTYGLLELLNARSQSDVLGRTILDIGCGSGILGIFSSFLGSNDVYFSDFDEVAIEITKENINLNKNEKLSLDNVILSDGFQLIERKFDLIICNLIEDIILSFQYEIFNHLEDQGLIYVSGILNSNYERFKNEMETYGLEEILNKKMEEFSLGIFKKVL